MKCYSEGSCDTEDWSNDDENSAFTLHLKIYSNSKQLFYIIIVLTSKTFVWFTNMCKYHFK